MSADNEDERSPIDPIELRRAFGTFVTGVTVVTTLDEDGMPRGMTANSFTSVSLDPPLLLVCIGKKASSAKAFDAARSFAVNILHDRQKDVASVFASKSLCKFDSVEYDAVNTRAPVLTDSLSWFDCALHERVDAGDHVILIGRVVAFGSSPAAPLGFCRGSYVNVEDPMPAGWGASHRMMVCHLVEHGGRILLRGDGSGGWGLPTESRSGARKRIDLDEDGRIASISLDAFLYSVFDVADEHPGYVIYRSVLADPNGAVAELPPTLKFFAPEELPWNLIRVRQVRAMLRRYLHERQEGRFGIYNDSDDGGRIAMIGGTPRPWSSLSGVASEHEAAEG